MKKIRKVLICYLIFFLFINIINSCGGVADYYRINSLNSVAQRIVSLDKNGNYIADDLNTFSDTIRIRYDSLRIKLTTDNYLALNNQTKSNIGIQSALAWSKAVEYEKIFEIEITSNKDYNSVYKAGTNLKKIMSFGDVTKCSID